MAGAGAAGRRINASLIERAAEVAFACPAAHQCNKAVLWTVATIRHSSRPTTACVVSSPRAMIVPRPPPPPRHYWVSCCAVVPHVIHRPVVAARLCAAAAACVLCQVTHDNEDLRNQILALMQEHVPGRPAPSGSGYLTPLHSSGTPAHLLLRSKLSGPEPPSSVLSSSLAGAPPPAPGTPPPEGAPQAEGLGQVGSRARRGCCGWGPA